MELFSEGNRDITLGIESKIYQAIDKSIENNSKESFHILKSFIRKVLQLSIREKSLKHFEQYIFFPIVFYSISYEKKSHDQSLEHIHKICTSNGLLHLKEIIRSIGFNADKSDKDSDRKIYNEFYYLAFTSFSQLIYLAIKNGDTKQFKSALEEYDQIATRSQSYELKLNLRVELIDGGIEKDHLKKLKEKIAILNQFETYRRHLLLGVKYWIIFLFRIGKLTEELTLEFISNINIRYMDSKEILEDILFFRSNNLNKYFKWDDWDFTERRSGKAYSPPNPRDWLTFGFMIDQIVTKRLPMDFRDIESQEFRDVKFLHDNLKEYQNSINTDFDKWKKILNVKSTQELDSAFDQLLSYFVKIKRKGISNIENEISLAPLSKSKIEDYRNLVGKSWVSEARINKLFKKIGTVELVSDNEIKLKRIGQKTFFKKAKMMFIEGEHYQSIYGVNIMGGEIGRWEDSEFFNTIIKDDHYKVNGASILEVLNQAIAELKSKEITPDLILLSPEFSYKDRAFLESKFFTPKDENLDNESYLGQFDSIPIYISFSDFLKNRVLVCEFTKAFKMRYKTNNDWYNRELNIEVNEVSNDEALKRLKEEPNEWKITEDGMKLSDEDALTLIKTSVVINHWSTLDFQILNKESYIIGGIKTKGIDE